MANIVKVKYSNELNILGIRSMSKIENDVFYAMLYQLKDQQDGIEITLTELKSLIGKSQEKTAYIHNAINAMAEKFSQFVVKYENKESTKFFSVFEVLEVPNKDPSIKAKLSNQFLHIVNNVESEFTLFDLAVYTSFSSKHSQTLYRLLRQFNSTGYYKVSFDKFKELLDIKPSYQLSNIDKRILEQAIKDFKTRKIYKNLTIQKIKSKTGKGNKVTHIEFIFTPQTQSNYEKLQEQEKTTIKDTRYAESVANRQQILENQKAKQQIKQHNVAAMAAGCNAWKKDNVTTPAGVVIMPTQNKELSDLYDKYHHRTFIGTNKEQYKIVNFYYEDSKLKICVKDENGDTYDYPCMNFESIQHFKNHIKDYLI